MPVPSSISDLSTTPALNSPPGSESPSSIDDYLRTLSAFIRQINDLAATLAATKADDSAVVKLTGAQTVAGTKTFSASPVAPNPTAGTRSQALATMQMFADEFAAWKSPSGYQKLPSGLIIQWGGISYSASSGADGTTASLPIAFPTAFLKALGGDTGYATRANGVQPVGLSQIRGWGRNSGGDYADTGIAYFAIGY